MIISHNIAAMNVSRNLMIVDKEYRKNTRKLASGYRINVAADDAAGLSISEKMRAQIRGLKRASDNIQDGISLIQTAEGALGEIQAMLHRMRELSVQGANDTNMDEDRAAIQDELDELTAEIDHVAKVTEFNKKTLLDGSRANPSSNPLRPFYYTMHSGEEKGCSDSLEVINGERAGEYVTLQEAAEAEGLTIIYTELEDDFETVQTESGKATASGYENLKKTLEEEIVPQAVKSLMAAFPGTFDYLKSSSIGIGLKLENNPASTALASVGIGFLRYSDGTLVKDQFSYTLTVNMGYLSMDASGGIASDPTSARGREALETTIVHEMMHALMDETLTNGMIGAKDGKSDPSNQYPGWFKEGMAQAAAGGCSPYNDWVNGGLRITAASSEASISSTVKNTSNSLASGTTASKYGTGYLACMYLGYLAEGASSLDEGSIAGGLDKILSQLKNGKSMDDVIRENTPYAGVADFEGKFGDSASSSFMKALVIKVGAGNGGLAGGSYASTDLLPDTSYQTNLFKLNTKNETVTNKYPSDVEKLTDGGKTYAGSGTTGGTGGTGGGTGGSGGTGSGTGGGSGGTGGGTGGPGGPAGGLYFQIGANSGQGITVYIDNMDAGALGIQGLSVADHEKAGEAIEALDDALQEVARQRSLLGASQNRLEYSLRNTDNSEENLQAAESRIRDLDMAEEAAAFSRSQILLQTGQAMLAQTVHASDSILQLLQG